MHPKVSLLTVICLFVAVACAEVKLGVRGDGWEGIEAPSDSAVEGFDDGDAAQADASDLGEADGGGVCITDNDCQNGTFCDGRERCVDGECLPPEKVACDDGEPCTIDFCDEETDTCSREVDDSRCDDGQICTGIERCDELYGCVSGPVPDCADTDICTIDLCVEERGECIHEVRDLDRDGHVDRNCGGDDCNDRDAEVNPEVAERCGDGKDNDCNGMVDTSDPACRSTNDTCMNPLLLIEGVEVVGSTQGAAHNYESNSCLGVYFQRDVAFRIDLAAPRDLIVQVETVTGGSLVAAIQTSCGNSSTELTCEEGNNVSLRQNRAATGTYYVIVWTAVEGNFRISYTTAEPALRPANDVCTGAVDVSGGGTFRGTTTDCLDDYSPSCSEGGGWDAFYTFAIAEPRRVTLSLSGIAGWVTASLSLMTNCGDPASELECATSEGSATIQRNFLDVGTYWVAVDLDIESSYTLTVAFDPPIYPPPNDRCSGAVDVSGGGPFVGTLAGSYRDYTTSCSSPTYVDVAYVFATTELLDVTLVLSPIGAAADMALAVVADCSDLRTVVRCRRGNPAGFTMRSLPPGTYYIIVSGTLHGTGARRGRYLLEVSFGPPTPAPPNDLCSGALDVTAGGVFIESTVGTFDDYDTDCGPSNYYDLVYSFTLAAGSDVMIDVAASVGSTEIVLEIGRACGVSSSRLDCVSSTSGDLHVRSLPAGTYYLIVDTEVETDFNMTITYGPPTTLCDGATVINVDLSSGSFRWRGTGSTVGEANKFEATCAGSAASPDVPYRLIVPERAFITFENTAANFDTALHIRSLCDSPSSELYCNDDNRTSCPLCSYIAATFEAGTYFVIQDGFGSRSQGTYTLEINARRAP